MFNVWWIIQNLFYALRSPEFNKDMFGCELCGLNSGNSKNFKQSILTKICKIPKEGFCFFDMEFICHETIF